MRKILINNSGLVMENNYNKKENIGFNFGLIGSATPSMINDIPDREQIKNEVYMIKIIDTELNKSLSIPHYIINWILRKNRTLLDDYFKELDLQSFSINLSDYNISGISKCGALLKDGNLEQVRRMALNDAHYQYFEKDFLSYFLYLNFIGRIAFTDKNARIRENINFKFYRIPLLCFKSENASINGYSRDISVAMLKVLSCKKNIDAIFI